MPTPIMLLEARRLMSAAVKDGVLTVEGSPLADAISIRQQPGPTDAPVYAVEIGPADGSKRPTQIWFFPLDEVHSMIVRAGPGNDVVDLALATYAMPGSRFWQVVPVSVPTRIDASTGDDQVYGGTARDFIAGGFGKDRIDGGAGDDWIDGGRGDDVLHGNQGDDFVYGNSGDDVVGGDAGNDRLYGGTGNDFLGSLGFGPAPTEPGDDLLVGGPGEDRLVGGDGKDRLFGGAGRDHFSRADDESEMLDRTPDEPIDIVLPV